MKLYRVTLRTPWKELPVGWKWALVSSGLLASMTPLLAQAWVCDEYPTLTGILALPPWCPLIPLGWFLFTAWGNGRPYLLGFLGALIATCAGYLVYQTGCWQPVLWEGTKVRVLASADSERGEGDAVIKDERSWKRYWHASDSLPPPLPIDWRSQMAVIRKLAWDGDFTLPSSRIELRQTGQEIRVLRIIARTWVDPDQSWLMVYERTTTMVVGRTELPVHDLPPVCVRRFADFDLKAVLTRILCYPESYPIIDPLYDR
jgi:hypothetical protein